jgi:hypothetical protein
MHTTLARSQCSQDPVHAEPPPESHCCRHGGWPYCMHAAMQMHGARGGPWLKEWIMVRLDSSKLLLAAAVAATVLLIGWLLVPRPLLPYYYCARDPWAAGCPGSGRPVGPARRPGGGGQEGC